MRKVPLAGAAAALVLAVAGAVSISAASQAAGPSPATSKTLVFFVKFSPFTIIESNTDNPEAPAPPGALGDIVLFHDQLFSHGQHVGDTAGNCVVVGVTPPFPNNCSGVFRLPGGTITTQFETAPGPGAKPIALTGGSGIYSNIGGDGSLLEFGNGTGRLTLHILRLGPQGEEA